MKRLLLIPCCAAVAASAPFTANGQEVWTGPPVAFTKADWADWTLPENQDRITDKVWITRQDLFPLINAKVETTYLRPISPKGTEWAVGEIADWATLTYSNFLEYAGGLDRIGYVVTGLGPSVLHLIEEDIYIPVEFTAWTRGRGDHVPTGGGFSYTRGTPSGLPVESNTWGQIKALYE